ncbi:MAG: hypothetical protein NTV29_03390 [Planctomycetota bacterium]|nr:hypothetical protein [Planctomycetota bacterium]
MNRLTLRLANHNGTLRLALLAICLWLTEPTRGFCQQAQNEPLSNPASPGELSDSPTASSPFSKSDRTVTGKYRFEPSASKEYRVERARRESQAREDLLRHYQAIGFDYAHPTYDGMALNPYRPKRRVFFVQPIRPW